MYYKLIGFLNLFDIVPDFVFPVFEHNGSFYFQNGKKDKIEMFEKVKDGLQDRIIQLKAKESLLLTIVSKPIYAFQKLEEDIEYGTAAQIAKVLNEYKTNDSILQKEIEEFYGETGITPTTFTRDNSVTNPLSKENDGKIVINQYPPVAWSQIENPSTAHRTSNARRLAYRSARQYGIRFGKRFEEEYASKRKAFKIKKK